MRHRQFVEFVQHGNRHPHVCLLALTNRKQQNEKIFAFCGGFWRGVRAVAPCPVAHAQEVYVGTGNGRDAMIAQPNDWSYVRQNADGFYVNFIQMLKMDKEKCAQMAGLFSHKNAFYESDSRYKGLGGFPDGGQFSRALQTDEVNRLLDGGFQVKYASLNYGVDADKKTDLQHVGMKKGKTRPVFAQFGPWNFGGDLAGDTGKNNAQSRRLIEQNDGGVTDGPIGFWKADVKGMKGGSISLVKFSHGLHKKAVVMVCPYGAGVKTYDFGQWLADMQECVRDHEDAGAKPDVWAVFEYATSVPALPETVEGKPANTTMGAAYWLLHHLRDPKHDAQITVPEPTDAIADAAANTETRRVFSVTVRNRSTWLDLCPVLFARLDENAARNWKIRFWVDGKNEAESEMGLPFTGNLRLWPGTTRRIQVVLERRAGGAQNAPLPLSLRVGLHPNPSNNRDVTQTLVLRLPQSAPAVALVQTKTP